MGRQGAAAGVSLRLSRHRQSRPPAHHAPFAEVTAALVLASLVGLPMKLKAKAAALPARAQSAPSAPSASSASSSSLTTKPSGPVLSEPEAGGTHTRLET